MYPRGCGHLEGRRCNQPSSGPISVKGAGLTRCGINCDMATNLVGILSKAMVKEPVGENASDEEKAVGRTQSLFLAGRPVTPVLDPEAFPYVAPCWYPSHESNGQHHAERTSACTGESQGCPRNTVERKKA